MAFTICRTCHLDFVLDFFFCFFLTGCRTQVQHHIVRVLFLVLLLFYLI